MRPSATSTKSRFRARSPPLFDLRPPSPPRRPVSCSSVTAKIIAGEGDDLPVSAMPIDGTFPTATAQWEKRNIALEIPEWDEELCIQCGKCVLVCPHSVIRAKVYDEPRPGGRARHLQIRARALEGHEGPQVHPAGGARRLHRLHPVRAGLPGQEQERSEAPRHQHGGAAAAARTRSRQLGLLPEDSRDRPHSCSRLSQVKDVQLLQPLFEFSGACSGCGETPYIKLMTQLFGDRMLIANATGCSSIYGGNLPTTPYCTNEEGRGPAWSNSLFEDNAEFGLGMRLAVDKQNEYARELVWRLGFAIGEELAQAILNADQKTEAGHLRAARARQDPQGQARRPSIRPKRATCSASPTRW